MIDYQLKTPAEAFYEQTPLHVYIDCVNAVLSGYITTLKNKPPVMRREAELRCGLSYSVKTFSYSYN